MNNFEKTHRPFTLEQWLEIKVRAENGANDTEIATATNLGAAHIGGG
jgi:hypothetical protein